MGQGAGAVDARRLAPLAPFDLAFDHELDTVRTMTVIGRDVSGRTMDVVRVRCQLRIHRIVLGSAEVVRALDVVGRLDTLTRSFDTGLDVGPVVHVDDVRFHGDLLNCASTVMPAWSQPSR